MVWKKSGQFQISDQLVEDHWSLHSLDKLEKFINWNEIEEKLSPVYSSKKGRASYPPLILFKSLLLGSWYQLSDSRLEQMLARDLLFRSFSGISLSERIPDHSTLSRFRQQLNKHQLWETLFNTIKLQLEKRNIILKQGEVSIIDATVVEAHQNKNKRNNKGNNTQDPDAKWLSKVNSKGKKTSTYGYKVHANTDEDGFIKKVCLTEASVHDSKKLKELLTGTEEEVYADSAYYSREIESHLKESKICHKGYRNHPLTKEQIYQNKLKSSCRYKVESAFGILKNHFQLRKMRFVGEIQNYAQVMTSCMAYNLKLAEKFM